MAFSVILIQWFKSQMISSTKTTSISNQCLPKYTVHSAVKMRFYGLCPALRPHHLLEEWNSEHVAFAHKGFTSKFNPKTRDMGICVGSECRLAKEDHKAHKQMWWWERCWTDALTPILFFFPPPVQSHWRKDTAILWVPAINFRFKHKPKGGK